MSDFVNKFDSKAILDILLLSKDATAIYSEEDIIVMLANPAMMKLWGKDKPVTGMRLEDAVPELKGQPFINLLKNVWRSGETFEAKDMPAELLVDGRMQTFYFDFIYRPIRNAQEEIFCILHTATEVSNRRASWKAISEKEAAEQVLLNQLSAANEELQTANEDLAALNEEYQSTNEQLEDLNNNVGQLYQDLRNMIGQVPSAMMLLRGADMQIEMINPGMLELIGKDNGIIGKKLFKEMPELNGQPAAEMIRETFYTGTRHDGEGSLVRLYRDGELRDCYFNFTYVPFVENGQITGVIDMAVEVTAQVAAAIEKDRTIAEKTALEQKLRSSEQRLQGILDTMAEGVGIIDKTGQLIYANPMAQRILGLQESVIKDRTYDDPRWTNLRVDGSLLPAEEHPMAIMMRTGRPVYDHEISVQPPEGERVYISINAAPIFDEQGELSGGIGTFMDVTGRRIITQHKDDFISIASHELKTPVTSMKAALQLLNRGSEHLKPEMHTRLVDQAMRSLEKLNKLINDLLDTNRISQGQLQLQKESFLVSDLFNDCCHHVISAGSHEVIFEGNKDIKLYADEQQISQVLVNFVNNAVKYAPDSKKIIIDATQVDQDTVRISVTDYGPGVAPEKLAFLFERYYRADYSGRRFSGLGLGLFISAEIVKKHGGEIGADSEPGKGSTFWFTIPTLKNVK